MDAVEKASINEAASVDEPDGQKLAANILGEMIAAKHDVQQAFAKRTALEASLDDKSDWAKEQQEIARLWCEAKWTDVLSQKLADLLQEQTREHGALLHKLRLKRAAMLDKALRLHSDALWRHDRACALMEKKGDALIEAGKKHDAVVEAKNEEIASLKERIAELERNRDADRALFERQAEAKVKRSRDALEAMKELFLDMGKDKTDLAKMDARDDVQRMRRELAESMKELQELRLLRDGAQMDRAEVARARRELKAQRTATAAHTRELDARADRVNELMMARAELEHYVTTDRQKREEAKTLKGGPREEGQVLDFKLSGLRRGRRAGGIAPNRTVPSIMCQMPAVHGRARRRKTRQGPRPQEAGPVPWVSGVVAATPCVHGTAVEVPRLGPGLHAHDINSQAEPRPSPSRREPRDAVSGVRPRVVLVASGRGAHGQGAQQHGGARTGHGPKSGS